MSFSSGLERGYIASDVSKSQWMSVLAAKLSMVEGTRWRLGLLPCFLIQIHTSISLSAKAGEVFSFFDLSQIAETRSPEDLR